MTKSKYIATGFKRLFAPAYVKAMDIVKDPAFGDVSSFSMRYPVSLPPEDSRENTLAMSSFLEFVHPYSLLVGLFGDCEGFTFMRSSLSGGLAMNLRYTKGIVGTLHLAAGQAATSPLERLEIVGAGANVVVENNCRLTYYRPGGTRGERESKHPESFIGADDTAPIVWEPEFSLGQLYNKQLFLEGYVGCVRHFAEQLLAGEPPRRGTLVQMMHIIGVYDRIRTGKENQWIRG